MQEPPRSASRAFRCGARFFRAGRSAVTLRLRVPELRIFAALVREQRLVRALLDDLSGVEHNDLVAELAGGEPVRNVDRRLVAHHVVELFVDLRLGDRVERGGRLVENEEGRVFIERAGDGDLLPLAAGDLDAVLVKIAEEARLRSERQRFEPVAEAGLPERFLGSRAVIFRRGGHVLPERKRQQLKVLEHNGEHVHILPVIIFPNIYAIE